MSLWFKLGLLPFKRSLFFHIISIFLFSFGTVFFLWVFWFEEMVLKQTRKHLFEKTLVLSIKTESNQSEIKNLPKNIELEIQRIEPNAKLQKIEKSSMLYFIQKELPEIVEKFENSESAQKNLSMAKFEVVGEFTNEVQSALGQLPSVIGAELVDGPFEKEIQDLNLVSNFLRVMCVFLMIVLAFLALQFQKSSDWAKEEHLKWMLEWGATPMMIKTPRIFRGAVLGLSVGILSNLIFVLSSRPVFSKIVQMTTFTPNGLDYGSMFFVAPIFCLVLGILFPFFTPVKIRTH